MRLQRISTPNLRPHSRRTAVLCQQASGAPSSSKQEAWFQGKLAPFIGPISLQKLEERGRGVVAERDIQLGELIIATDPVAILNSSAGVPREEGDKLVDKIIEQGLYKRTWLQYMYDGTADSCTVLPDLRTPADSDASASAAAHTSTSTSTSAPATGPASKAGGFGGGSKVKSKVKASQEAGSTGDAEKLDRKAARRIAKITKFNCFGDDHDDLALCELRGDAPRGHVGVWGPFAMLNHSCAPNAINYVVGDTMVVRAAKPIEAGEEVVISYLGRPQLAPVGPRRVKLQEDYGFECSCERCMQEMVAEDKLKEEVYESFYTQVCSKLKEQFTDAKDEADDEEMRAIYEVLQDTLFKLSGIFRKAFLSPQARLYVTASLYDALELKEEYAHGLSSTLKAVEAVTPGSDLHCILAAQLHAACVKLHGSASDEARTSLARARSAHQARYGQLPEDVTDKLIHLNNTLYG